MRRLKFLPWGSLLQVGGFAVMLAIALDWLLLQLHMRVDLVQQVIHLLLTPPLSVITPFLAAMGISAIAVYLLERFYPEVAINASVLWALVPCVLLFLVIWNILPLPKFIFGGSIQLVAIVLGIFLKGHPYWR